MRTRSTSSNKLNFRPKLVNVLCSFNNIISAGIGGGVAQTIYYFNGFYFTHHYLVISLNKSLGDERKKGFIQKCRSEVFSWDAFLF